MTYRLLHWRCCFVGLIVCACGSASHAEGVRSSSRCATTLLAGAGPVPHPVLQLRALIQSREKGHRLGGRLSLNEPSSAPQQSQPHVDVGTVSTRGNADGSSRR
jgi:hypothetical protein